MKMPILGNEEECMAWFRAEVARAREQMELAE